MSDIAVQEMEPGWFGVQVDEGHQTTSHRVSVPEGFLNEIGAFDVPAEEAVRETFAFLLEREPATSILESFSLADVYQHFSEFPTELRDRLTEPA